MALTTASLTHSLHSIGISQAKGVDLPMLKEQNEAILPKAESTTSGSASSTSSNNDSASKDSTRFTASKALTAAQQRQVTELQQIERDVIAHEQAHMAAGHGVITSGPDYTYTYGPDGKRYATGGEVGIDTAAERKPEANIDKGIRIQAAALAPQDPSPQDYQVAAVGGRLESKGRTDLTQQQLAQQAEDMAKAEVRKEASQSEQTKASGNEVSSTSKAAAASQGLRPVEQTPEVQAQTALQQQNASARQTLAQAYTPPKADSATAAISVFA